MVFEGGKPNIRCSEQYCVDYLLEGRERFPPFILKREVILDDVQTVCAVLLCETEVPAS